MRSKEFRQRITDGARAGLEVTPRCRHAFDCGGCAFQERVYTAQVAAKTAVLRELWAGGGYGDLSLEVVPSPDSFNYRTRMDYVATKGRFGLRRRGKFNYIVELEECHLIPPASFEAAHALWLRAQELGLPDYNIRTHEGFLRYLVVRRSPDDALLLAAVTAAGPYEAQMEALAQTALAQPGVVGFHWLLNDSLTDISFGTPLRHWGAATLPMVVGQHTLHIGPNTFFQNNVHLLGRLLDDVTEALGARSEGISRKAAKPAKNASYETHLGELGGFARDVQTASDSAELGSNAARSIVGRPSSVADLYGGVGTIALHLAPYVASIVTVESVAESGELARENIALNDITNVQSVTADVLPFLREQRPGAFEVVVADPPRTGLGPEVCAELLRIAPERIVYVSCNPLTQLEDVKLLAHTYDLVALTGYDMFPHTPHVETLGILVRQDFRLGIADCRLPHPRAVFAANGTPG